jgi:hypothetical protein
MVERGKKWKWEFWEHLREQPPFGTATIYAKTTYYEIVEVPYLLPV